MAFAARSADYVAMMVTVFQWSAWSTAHDDYVQSTRWASMEAINRIGGIAVSEGVDIDDSFLGSEVIGMTVRGFDARNPPMRGFQTVVR